MQDQHDKETIDLFAEINQADQADQPQQLSTANLYEAAQLVFLHISVPSLSTLQDRYEIYLSCANDGKGIDITTGRKLKTFDEWLNS